MMFGKHKPNKNLTKLSCNVNIILCEITETIQNEIGMDMCMYHGQGYRN